MTIQDGPFGKGENYMPENEFPAAEDRTALEPTGEGAGGPAPELGRDRLSLVISACDEEGNVEELYRRLKAALAGLGLKEVEYLFVDDGSTDRTLERCLALQATDPEVKIVRLWRNFGHETAMAAGLDHASGEAVVFLDADLQHPPELVREMVELWRKGQDLVLTKRLENTGVPAWRRLGSRLFYRLLNQLSETPLPAGGPDFRLLGAKYIKFLKSFNERDYLFRGFLAWGVPLNQAAVLEFSAPPRRAGTSKYSFFKSLNLALNSILQFSVKPLFLSLWLAALTALFALGLGVQVVAERYILNNPTPGFATIVMVTLIMGASNLIVLTIIGAYIAKIHLETKKRPPYMADFLAAGSRSGEEAEAGPGERP